MTPRQTANEAMRERVVVGSIIQAPDSNLTPSLARVLDSAPEGFEDPVLGLIALATRKARSDGQPCDVVSIAKHLDGEHTGALMQLTNEEGTALPLALAEMEAAELLESMRSRQVFRVFAEAQQMLRANPAKAAAIAECTRGALAQVFAEAPKTPGKLLESLRFDPAKHPPPLRAIYTLAEIPVATPGNIVTITSAIKTGKSAVIGAMAASAMTASDAADCLSFRSANPEGKALLWFDSEQSPDDFWHCVTRAVRRAGLTSPPPWFYAYRLTGLGAKRGWECVTNAIKIVAERHSGVHSVLLDGMADFIADVNDAEESNNFVAALHGMAIERDCPIVGVIHFNPGTEKSRGHLGSQLERKAESNLALEKDADGTTVIFSSKNRRAGISKDRGPRFRFDPEQGMHVSIESRQSAAEQAKREELLSLARDVFAERPAMRYAELKSTVITACGLKERQAERKIADMKRLTVIKPMVAGFYEIAMSAESK